MGIYNNAYELANKRKGKEDFAEALSELKVNRGENTNNFDKFINSYNSSYGMTSGGGNGLNALGRTLGGKLADFKFGNQGASTSAITNAINGTGGSGSAITDAINGVGGSGNSLADALSSSTTSSGGAKGWGGGMPWGLIGGVAKGGYNAISNKNDEDYSDLEESTIYPLQGAATGASFGGPWGALGGALYGLGYSLKDDLGMKDSNFLTKVIFPIGMGDGGGFIDIG